MEKIKLQAPKTNSNRWYNRSNLFRQYSMMNTDPKTDNRLETVISTIFVIKIAFSTSEEDDEEDNSTMVGVCCVLKGTILLCCVRHSPSPRLSSLREIRWKQRGKRARSPSIVERLVQLRSIQIALALLLFVLSTNKGLHFNQPNRLSYQPTFCSCPFP